MNTKKEYINKDGKVRKVISTPGHFKVQSSTALCDHCSRPYCIATAQAYDRGGYCGKRCKRYHKKGSRKWRTQTKRTLKQSNRKSRTEQGLIDFYESRAWRELRFKILRKYGSTCMACFRPGKIGFPMHVDHIKPRSKYPALELDPDNLQVLCIDCNLGKSNYSEDDLRPKD